MFDAHLHIIDPRFPMIPNQGFLPDPFGVDDYLRRVEHLGITGGAVVSGSFQGFDQSYLEDALARLGPSFVGVTQLPAETSDDEVLRLDAIGVRAVRFNLFRGGSLGRDQLERVARRVYDLAGWHVELYVDSADLAQMEPTIRGLPSVCIDHLGMSDDGLDVLARLVRSGCRVKACGFGRVKMDIERVIDVLAAANPEALLFATDLPSTRARRPFEDTDIDRLRAALRDATHSTQIPSEEMVLSENAVKFYRPRQR